MAELESAVVGILHHEKNENKTRLECLYDIS